MAVSEHTKRMPDKHPAEVLDYKFEMADLLVGAETAVDIEADLLNPHDGALALSTSPPDTATASLTVWISGGTAGHDYYVQATMTTSSSPTARQPVRKILVPVRA